MKRLSISNNYGTESKEKGITGTCRVFVTPDGERTMQTYLGITQSFSDKELDYEAIKSSKMIYVEGYLVSSTLGFEPQKQ